MTIWYVDSAATGANNGTSWTDAWVSVSSAFTSVTTANDSIYISHAHNEQLAADVAYTVDSNHTIANPLKVYSVNKTSGLVEFGAFVGHSSSNRGITFTGASVGLYLYGLDLKIAGSNPDNITFRPSSANYKNNYFINNCRFTLNSSAGSLILVGSSSNAYGSPTSCVFVDCYFVYGNTSQSFRVSGSITKFIGCTMSNGSTHPSILFSFAYSGSNVECINCDLSTISTIASGVSIGPSVGSLTLRQCLLKSGVVSLDSSTVQFIDVFLYDCASNDFHSSIGHSNAFGTLQIDTGIYCNDTIADNLSWKITSSADAGYLAPYVTPWMSVYHSGTSAITPYIEILRSGSATAFTDAEVWAEWSYKGTSGSTRATLADDHVLPLISPANQETSSKMASDWTGENVTSWFGKLGPASSITPAEAGDLSFRICVGIASTTLYVDPHIRGLA